jgi:CRP-like cAMP-binding protein
VSRHAWSSPLTRKLSVYIDLVDRERAALHDLEAQTEHLEQGFEVQRRGDRLDRARIVRDGWAVRSKTLADGRRQIIDFVLPGTIIGLYCHVTPVAEETVTALTPMILAPVPPERVLGLFAEQPRLGSALAWLSAREDHILAERLVSMGRRSAYERVGHLFLELWERLRVRGLAGNGRLPMPLTQNVLADTLGLSVVHVNRTLSQLARDELIAVRRRERMLVILDHRKLERAAGFEPDYLLHHRIPVGLESALSAFDGRRPGNVAPEGGAAPPHAQDRGADGAPQLKPK